MTYSMFNRNNYKKITANDRLADVILNEYQLLLVLNRFDIPLGFGDKSIKNVCAVNNVNTSAFLFILNLLSNPDSINEEEIKSLPIEPLLKYLKTSHEYFLDYRLPELRIKLIDAIATIDEKIAHLILRFFDDYMREVRVHMEYENDKVFSYIEKLVRHSDTGNYSIEKFEKHHNSIEDKLSELKNIMIKYYPATQNSHQTNSVLFDIFLCEEDLRYHTIIEDMVLIPRIYQLENELTHEQSH